MFCPMKRPVASNADDDSAWVVRHLNAPHRDTYRWQLRLEKDRFERRKNGTKTLASFLIGLVQLRYRLKHKLTSPYSLASLNQTFVRYEIVGEHRQLEIGLELRVLVTALRPNGTCGDRL